MHTPQHTHVNHRPPTCSCSLQGVVKTLLQVAGVLLLLLLLLLHFLDHAFGLGHCSVCGVC